jgi:hypothetical protein
MPFWARIGTELALVETTNAAQMMATMNDLALNMFEISSGFVCDCVDFDQKAIARQTRNLNGGARWSMVAERTLIRGVHVRKFFHVEQETPAPEHVLQIGTGCLQNGLHVLQTLLGLLLDRVSRKFSRCRIRGALT